MKLISFSGTDIHGFLDRKIKFHRDVTFLTGINGSGKTTIINAIIALITPSVSALGALQYRRIRVDFEHEGKKSYIEAQKNGVKIVLLSSGSNEGFAFTKFSLDENVPSYKENEFEQQYYRELLSSNSQNAVLTFIASLPNPMFLGLDRRSRFDQEESPLRRIWRTPSQPDHFGRNVFGASLHRSLTEAAILAEDACRDMLISVGRISESFRRNLLLELLAVKPSESFEMLSLPDRADTQEMEKMRRYVTDLPKILDLPESDVDKRILAFLELLQGYAKKIPHAFDMSKLFDESDREVLSAILGWSVNKPQLMRIKNISEMVSKYNKEREEITREIDRYLHLVNEFLKDSGKHVKFTENGFIYFNIEGKEGDRAITSVSSGEAQIFVILTNLLFNSSAINGNVFIIDEPELSLHVQWQELFVDSVRAANPDVQYVLATHSPSIILEKRNKCVDVNKS